MERETVSTIDELHRRISNYETTHLEGEMVRLEELVQYLTEKERNATDNLITERKRNDMNTHANREFVQQNEKLRRELNECKKRLAQLKQERLAATLQPQPDSAELLDMRKKLGEMTHRLQKRSEETRTMSDLVDKYKKECNNLQIRCIELENGKSESEIVRSLQSSLDTQNTMCKQMAADLEVCRTRTTQLESQLQGTVDELEQVRLSSHNLTKELEEQGHNMDEVHKLLNHEISTVKQQKAKLRCDYLKVQADFVAKEREYNALQRDLSLLMRDKESVDKDLAIEKRLRTHAVADLEEAKARERELKEKLEKVESENQGELTALEQILATKEQKLVESMACIKDQDKQCDALVEEIKSLASERDELKEKCAKKTEEMAEMRKKLTGSDVMEAEMARLREELSRAKDKVTFMDREIKTLHVEYRGELADLTKKLALAQKDSFFATKNTNLDLNSTFVENQVKQLENELSTERRLLKEKTQELELLKREKVSSTIEEALKRQNLEARKSLSDAVSKLEAKNVEIEKKEYENVELRKELQKAYDQIANLEDDLHDIRQKIGPLENSVVYWKDLYQRRMHPPVSDSDADSNYGHELNKENVDEQHMDVQDRSSKADSMRYGMMRHEIAHRFKHVWMAMYPNSTECAKCHEHLPVVSTAKRCRDCNLIVHLSCARRMGKTCGLPADYAQLYVDAVSQQRVLEEQHIRHSRSQERMDTY